MNTHTRHTHTAHTRTHAKTHSHARKVRVEDTEADLYAAIDVACHKLKGKMRKLKEKAIARGKWPGAGGPRGATRIADVR